MTTTRFGGHRRDHDGWIEVAIAGGPRDRGRQHGALLASEIHEALRVVRYLVFNDTGVEFDWFARNAAASFVPMLRSNFNGQLTDGFGVELLDELEGIVEGVNSRARRDGARVTLDDLVGWNAYPELMCQWWPAVLAGKITPPVPLPATHPGRVAGRVAARRWHHFHLSCSAFVAAGRSLRDRGVLAAHTTWQRFANGDAYNVVLDITPARGHRLLLQSAPGYVHSNTDFWQTGAGLIVTETSLDIGGFDADGLPEFLRVRRACQHATSIRHWCDLFRFGNNGGYVNTWLLADTRAARVAAYELTLSHEVLQPPLRSGYYAACNIPLAVPIRQLDSNGPAGYDNVLMNAGRRVRLTQRLDAARGRLDAAEAADILADHHDVYYGRTLPSSRTVCGHLDNDDGAVGNHDGTGPWYPWGSLDGKVSTTADVQAGTFRARWGRACGLPLDVAAFLRERPQYGWLDGYMRDRPTQPWTDVGGLPKDRQT